MSEDTAYPGGTGDSAAEKEFAVLLARRAEKRIPEFESAEEINLVPYLDVMVNLIIFMLVTIAFVLPLGIINIFPPETQTGGGGGALAVTPKLNLTITVTGKGFFFAGTNFVVENIPKKDNGEYDYDTLVKQTVKIKDQFPNEKGIIVNAESNTRYEVIVKVIDSVRNIGPRVLFDDVQLAAGIAQ
jgi:biopolymer transport protein ExbD